MTALYVFAALGLLALGLCALVAARCVRDITRAADDAITLGARIERRCREAGRRGA